MKSIKPPNNVSLQLTRRCNLHCTHCYSVRHEGDEQQELPLHRIEMLLEDLSRLKMESITLLGGEPFIRKDVFEIVEKCIKVGIIPEIVTNGTFLTEHLAQKCKAVGLRHLAFSVDGLAKEHERIRGKRTFQQTMAAIEIAKRFGFHTRVISVATRSNLPSITQLLSHLRGRIDIHKIIYYTPFGYGSPEEWLPPREWLAYIQDLRREYRHDKSTVVTVQQPYTLEPRKDSCDLRAIYISADGEVYPCILLLDSPYSIGNLHDMNFIDLWDGPWRIKRRYSHCIGYSWLFNLDPEIPIETTHGLDGYYLGCMLQCNKGTPIASEETNLYIY